MALINLLANFIEDKISFKKFERDFILYYALEHNSSNVFADIVDDIMGALDACNLEDENFDPEWDITLYEFTVVCQDWLNFLTSSSFKIIVVID